MFVQGYWSEIEEAIMSYKDEVDEDILERICYDVRSEVYEAEEPDDLINWIPKGGI